MVQVTMQVSDELAQRILPVRRWMPTILELSLAHFRTPASATAAEFIEFLLQDPSDQSVLQYHVSDRAQVRLQRLLTLNQAGLLAETEQLELDELQQIEHFVIMLKAQLARPQMQSA